MRKQNSTFKAAFISESGSELANNDYFAFVELEKYACYVIADGLNDLPDAKSAKLAIETALLEFQEHPSMKKRALLSYIQAANRALSDADSRERLKASVTVVVTDYVKMRYAYAGNTRFRLYRSGNVKEQSRDMSLGSDIVREHSLPEDILSKHEERNNLYSYAGKGRGFSPAVSKKIRLENGDILVLYTRGIWENVDGGELDDVFSEAKDEPQECLNNVEDLLLSRQPERLENYTLAAVFVDKVFQDPEKKKRIKKIITICISVLVVVLAVSVLVWIFYRRRQKTLEEMNRKYFSAIEYIQDSNFVRAEEECKEALTAAEKLGNEGYIQEISDYLKLIEAVNAADENYSGSNYEEAQAGYVTAKERSRYADCIADEYIDRQLAKIAEYFQVYDYIQLGDTLLAKGDYARAEEKYLSAKSLATKIYYEDGRKEAMEALEALYVKREEAEEEDNQAAKEQAASEVAAVELTAEGDKAFAEEDYNGAAAYYAMSLEKYQELGDEVHAALLQSKMEASLQKAEENKEKEQQAEEYIEAGKEQEAAGNKLEAKKQYLFAKNIYRELKMDDKVAEVDGLIEILEVDQEIIIQESTVQAGQSDETME